MSLCQVAVKRAKTQLKSAMMMNLESRFITCEDIGRSASHTEDGALSLSLSISSSVLYVCMCTVQASTGAECKIQHRRTDRENW